MGTKRLSRESLKGIVISAALVTSLINAPKLIINKENNEPSQNTESHQMYDRYVSTYLKTLDDLEEYTFDEKFMQIYRKGKFNIDNIEYDVSELYVVVTKTGNHIVKAGENNIDILTGQTFDDGWLLIENLRKTTIFSKLYEDGIIKNENIDLNKETLKNYVDSWNMENHYLLPELIADREATKKI